MTYLHARAIDPSGFKPKPAQTLRFFTPALLNQQVSQRPVGTPVSGVDPGAQDLLSLVQLAAVGQQLGQLPGGVLVAGVGPGTHDLLGLVQVAALGQQPDGISVSGVSQGTQPVQVAAPDQQVGQLLDDQFPDDIPLVGVSYFDLKNPGG